MVVRILRGRYAALGSAPPAESELRQKASEIVDEAHRILRRRGGNLVDITRELVAEWTRKQ